MEKAIFAGSFDPFTKGHMHIVEKASKMFDLLYVVVANNEDKENQSPLDQRFKALKEVKMPENVQVLKLPRGLLVNMARQMHIHTLVRGYRNEEDLVLENTMAKKNHQHQSHIKTILIEADEEYKNISSSLQKGLK